MIDTFRLPPVHLNKEAADRIVRIVIARAEASLRFAVENPGDATEEWLAGYRTTLEEYERTRDPECINLQAGVLLLTAGRKTTHGSMSIYREDTFNALDGAHSDSTIKVTSWTNDTVTVTANAELCTLEIAHPSGWGVIPEPIDVAAIESVLLEHQVRAETSSASRRPFRVFLGHGGDQQWRVLRDELRDHHDFEIEAYEALPRAGQTIRDVLESMAATSAAAVLVLTGTDAMADGSSRGRQNVVHEVGYFQGRLGWEQVIVVVEEGIELFSNLDGTQQVRFSEGAISGATGAVVANLRRIESSSR